MSTHANQIERPSKWLVIAAFAAVYIIWGSTYYGIKLAIETVPPFMMASARFFISGIILYSWARWKGAEKPTLRDWRYTAIIGVALLLLGNGLVAWAELSIPSSTAALIVAVTPFWLTLIEWMRPGGERPTRAVIASLLIGFVGTALLVYRPGGGVTLLGAGALLLASFSWAAGSIYSRHVKLPKSPILTTGMEMMAGSIALFLASIALGEKAPASFSAISVNSIYAFLYLIVFGSLIGFTAYLWLLRASTPAMVSTYSYVNPIVAVWLGWWLGEEVVTTQTLVAAGIIVCSVAILTIVKARNIAKSRIVAVPEPPRALAESKELATV